MELIKDNIYRCRDDRGVYRYYVLLRCICGNYYFACKYKPAKLCASCSVGMPGRPTGYKMSKESRRKTSRSLRGTVRPVEVKNKIRDGVNRAYAEGIFSPGFKAGEEHPGYKHGCNLVNSAEYRKFRGIWNRCYNKNDKDYKYYGAKGIGICKEWLDDFTKFSEFLVRNGYKSGKAVHRTDPLGNYTPDNVVILDPSTHSRLHWIMRSYRDDKTIRD